MKLNELFKAIDATDKTESAKAIAKDLLIWMDEFHKNNPKISMQRIADCVIETLTTTRV